MTATGDSSSDRSMLGTMIRLGALNPLTGLALGAGTFAWGPSTAAAYSAAALAHPMRTALIDDHGSLSYLQLEFRSSRVAAGLVHRGVDPDRPIGLLCRNHRGFVEANIALAKLGARVVYLNPGLPKTQLMAVIEREEVGAVIADRDLLDRLNGIDPSVIVVATAPELDGGWSFPGLARWRPLVQLPRPLRSDDPVVLTSGTTGAPKGTTRQPNLRAVSAIFGVLEAIPYSRRDVIVLPAPLFHAWGLSQLLLGASLASTVVLRRSFDPMTTIDDVEALGANVLVAVPVMLHRMVETAADADLSSLRVVATSGSALPGDLATRWMEAAGPTLYSLYGSTEVGQICVADPATLQIDPSAAGRPLRGVDVRIIDNDGDQLGPGDVGRIVVNGSMRFDGYTDGRTKEVIDNFMDTGDLGYLDDDGSLTIVGRADDMIISGGENIFPINIERALLDDPAVVEAAVVGVEDADLGQRVQAVVVLGATDENPSSSADELRARLGATLARHEVPREIAFVDELPRNAAGKVLRTKLADPSLPISKTSTTRRKATS